MNIGALLWPTDRIAARLDACAEEWRIKTTKDPSWLKVTVFVSRPYGIAETVVVDAIVADCELENPSLPSMVFEAMWRNLTRALDRVEARGTL